MIHKFTKSDVYRTNRQVIKVGMSFESQFLFQAYTREGWNEGVQWNYDIYDIGGKRFLWGNVEPDRHIFSTKILEEIGLKARETSNIINAEERQEAVNKLLKEFCDSIDKGIHDPSPITSFNSFAKNLSEQHDFFPEKSLIEISKELLEKHIHYNWNKPEEKQAVKDKISLKMKKYMDSNLNFNDIASIKEESMNKMLSKIVADYKEKENIKKKQPEMESSM